MGEFKVLRPTRDGLLVLYCSIVPKAESADPRLYLLDGSVGSCTPTTLTFQHLAAEARIELSNSAGETGYLLRGDDPGPPPQ